MNNPSLKSIVEAILFASEKPLNAGELLKVIHRAKAEMEPEKEEEGLSSEPAPQSLEGGSGEETSLEEPSAEDQLAQAQQEEEGKLSRSDIQLIIDELVAEYGANPDRGFVLVNVAQGFQFRTRQELAPFLKAMNKVAPTKLSQAAMEVLSIVAYRQPIIRAEVDQIRGVDSGGVLKTLMDRSLIRIVGKKEEPGKPILYGTTDAFLEVFNLRSLQDLPTLKDLAQIEEEMKREAAQNSETVSLDEDFSEADFSEEAPETDFSQRFEDLEKEEEEALEELEQEMQQLKGLEEKVVRSIHPEGPPSSEGQEAASSSQSGDSTPS